MFLKRNTGKKNICKNQTRIKKCGFGTWLCLTLFICEILDSQIFSLNLDFLFPETKWVTFSGSQLGVAVSCGAFVKV